MTKFIREIEAFTIGMSIRVRAALQWRPQKFDTADYDGLHYVLVDEEGSSIHAMIEECYYGHMPMLMMVGEIYDISWFGSKKDDARQRVVDHHAILCFTAKTTFKRVEQDLPNFPKYSFRLLKFGQLAAEIGQQTVLADLYGCIKTARAPQEVDVKNPKKRETRTDIVIEFIRREELKVALWGEIAKSFPLQQITEMPPPVLAIFTGMRITEYKGHISASSTTHTSIVLHPNIEQTEQYKSEFSKTGDRVKVYGAFSNLMSLGVINEADKRTVSELKMLNPALDMTKSVYCSAITQRFFQEKGWFYRCCPVDKCYKHMLKQEQDDDRYFCNVHGRNSPKKSYKVYMIIEDDHDQAKVTLMGNAAEEFFGATCEELLQKTFYPSEITLPTEINSKVGQRFLFEIRINQRGELFLKSTRESGLRTEIIEGDTSGNQSLTKMAEGDTSGNQWLTKMAEGDDQWLKKMAESKEPNLETPKKIMYGKKTKRDENVGCLSEKTVAKKQQKKVDKLD